MQNRVIPYTKLNKMYASDQRHLYKNDKNLVENISYFHYKIS
jgi:hypothetical protein